MRRSLRLLIAGIAAVVLVSPAVPATADPGDDHSQESHSGPPELPPFTGSSSKDMTLVGNSDKDGTTNSDLAFWGKLAFSGNYNGFRILDISDPKNPQVMSDYFCRGPQNDVSVWKIGRRLILFQSIDRPQSKESCDGTQAGSSVDTPLITAGPDAGRAEFGFEGIRMFDVTDPKNPKFLDGMPTACGSHTHTLIPELRKQRLHLYVSSYPLGSGVTPDSYTGSGPRCASPHQKISIVTVPFADPLKWATKEKALSDDTDTYADAVPGNPLAPPFKACHDIQVLMKRDIAVGSCAGDTQIWDVRDPANPTTGNGQKHTHVRSPSAEDRFEFMHAAVITWDGKYFATMDETGGGGSAECDGSAEDKGGQSESGFYYFYKLVKPGDPAPALLSRYMIPRPQGVQICVSHNANVIPLAHKYVMVAAYYQGGNSVVDFTDPKNPTEIAYSDLEDTTVGAADSWSTYWYNDHVYVNGGLNRRGPTANRGLDIFTITGDKGRQLKTGNWQHLNPQTQEVFQAP